MIHPTRRMNLRDLKLRTLPCATLYVSWWKGVTRHKLVRGNSPSGTRGLTLTTLLGAYSIL